MKKIFDIFEKIAIYALAILFSVMVLSIFLQIIQRFAFASPNAWSEELTRYSFAWLSMIGAAVAVRKYRHMNIDYFINKLPARGKKVLEAFNNILVVALLFILIIYGFQLVAITFKQISPGLNIPMAYAYLSVPVGGILMLLFTIEAYIETTFGKSKEASEEV